MNVFFVSFSQQIPVGLIEPIDIDGIKPIYSISPLKDKKKKMARKYINRDLTNKILKSYQTQVMLGEKLIYNNVDILNFVCSKMNESKLLYQKALYPSVLSIFTTTIVLNFYLLISKDL